MHTFGTCGIYNDLENRGWVESSRGVRRRSMPSITWKHYRLLQADNEGKRREAGDEDSASVRQHTRALPGAESMKSWSCSHSPGWPWRRRFAPALGLAVPLIPAFCFPRDLRPDLWARADGWASAPWQRQLSKSPAWPITERGCDRLYFVPQPGWLGCAQSCVINSICSLCDPFFFFLRFFYFQYPF